MANKPRELTAAQNATLQRMDQLIGDIASAADNVEATAASIKPDDPPKVKVQKFKDEILLFANMARDRAARVLKAVTETNPDDPHYAVMQEKLQKAHEALRTSHDTISKVIRNRFNGVDRSDYSSELSQYDALYDQYSTARHEHRDKIEARINTILKASHTAATNSSELADKRVIALEKEGTPNKTELAIQILQDADRTMFQAKLALIIAQQQRPITPATLETLEQIQTLHNHAVGIVLKVTANAAVDKSNKQYQQLSSTYLTEAQAHKKEYDGFKREQSALASQPPSAAPLTSPPSSSPSPTFVASTAPRETRDIKTFLAGARAAPSVTSGPAASPSTVARSSTASTEGRRPVPSKPLPVPPSSSAAPPATSPSEDEGVRKREKIFGKALTLEGIAAYVASKASSEPQPSESAAPLASQPTVRMPAVGPGAVSPIDSSSASTVPGGQRGLRTPQKISTGDTQRDLELEQQKRQEVAAGRRMPDVDTIATLQDVEERKRRQSVEFVKMPPRYVNHLEEVTTLLKEVEIATKFAVQQQRAIVPPDEVKVGGEQKLSPTQKLGQAESVLRVTLDTLAKAEEAMNILKSTKTSDPEYANIAKKVLEISVQQNAAAGAAHLATKDLTHPLPTDLGKLRKEYFDRAGKYHTDMKQITKGLAEMGISLESPVQTVQVVKSEPQKK